MNTTTSARIAQLMPSMGATSRRVAQFFLDNPDRVLECTVEQLAGEIGVSTATVSRFSKVLGYGSYSQMRLGLSSQLTRADDPRGEVEDSDSALQSARKTLETNIEALRGTADFIDGTDVDHAVQLISDSQTLGIFGLGSSNVVAQYAYHMLLRLPLRLVQPGDYHMQLMAAAKLSPGDVGLIISHTGNDADINLLAEQLREHGVPTIAITSYPNSPLAHLAEVRFSSLSEDTRYRAEALVSVTSQIGLVDVLFTELSRRYGAAADAELLKVRAAVASKHVP
ncbi:DNA-binding transcriptional regulator, MurR/RpiR family, contains HTH and SIS domains [Propionibacterium cyclohexanicum]|uniref:DNA-binding transcriptional regulator, MurR/RpiR family, contains HTH and SIS domains n=1 Tax=Propionibacterium cyclohexanicum TaxID=64702 RepID=A0A1H9QSN6_9ACTN|nr:MurR/RpiR family transcriptional regulator [Propionibacterium cyclohexanicum]SER62849.1 DNA-binding transcriptional regulator, MurR/RpiR family, contains HTH and SIS domains [Propionibacterium cyclohexanicum]